MRGIKCLQGLQLTDATEYRGNSFALHNYVAIRVGTTARWWRQEKETSNQRYLRSPKGIICISL